MAEKNTSLNMEENVASALCYVLVWLTGIIFFFVEKKSKTVKFHAMQSILTFLPLTIIGWVVGWLGTPSVSWSGGGYWGYSYNPGIPALIYLSWAIYAVTIILWILLIFKAYSGEKFKVPIIGNIAEKQANK